MIKNKRVGIVRVAHQLVDEAPEIVHLLFSVFIPLRAEIMPQGWIEYVGLSDLFEEREEGFVTPIYDVQIEREETGGYKIAKVEKT